MQISISDESTAV